MSVSRGMRSRSVLGLTSLAQCTCQTLCPCRPPCHSPCPFHPPCFEFNSGTDNFEMDIFPSFTSRNALMFLCGLGISQNECCARVKKSTRDIQRCMDKQTYWFSSGNWPMNLTCLFICKHALFVYRKYIGWLLAIICRCLWNTFHLRLKGHQTMIGHRSADS